MRNTGKSRKELLDELEGLRRQFADLEVSQDRLGQAEEASRDALKDAQQKQAENVALLKAVKALLEHREFKACAQAIFDSCKSIIGATAGYIALLSTDGTTTKPVFIDTGRASCAVDPSLPMPTRGMRAEAFHRSTAVYDNSFARSEHMKLVPKGHVTLDNVLFAPLMSEGKPVGLFGLANKPGGFTENDARLATWFAEVGSIALLNSHNLELLQHNEARWRSLIQTAVDAIITTDSRDKIVVWNQGAELVFGYSADEVIGKTIGLIIPEQLRKSHEEGINRVVSGGKPKIIGKTTECVGLRKDGSEFPLELTLGTWKQGAEMFFTAIVRDITQRKQVEVVAEEKARLEAEIAERQRSSPCCNCSHAWLLSKATEASSPNDVAKRASFSVKPPGLLAKPSKPTGFPPDIKGAKRTLPRVTCSFGTSFMCSLLAKLLSYTALPCW